MALGLQPYVSYHGGGLDNISTLNGGLTVRIPLVSYPQRGSSLKLSFSLLFNSFGFQEKDICTTSSDPNQPRPIHNCTGAIIVNPTGVDQNTPVGARLIVDQGLIAAGLKEQVQPSPPQGLLIEARYYIATADGAQHPLGRSATNTYRALDESGYLFTPSNSTEYPLNVGGAPGDGGSNLNPYYLASVPGTVTDSAGNVYTPNTITDLDGNAIQFSNGSFHQFGTFPITDSTNRTIPAPVPTNTGQCPTIHDAQFQTVSGAGTWIPPGTDATHPYILCFTNVTISTHFQSSVRPLEQYKQEVSMLQSIVLPNGQFWGFIYDAADPTNNSSTGLGQLIKLIYPTGGSVSYSYAPFGGFCNEHRPSTFDPNGISITILDQQIQQRTMYDSDGSIAGQWTYGYPDLPSGGLKGFIHSIGHTYTVTKFKADQTSALTNPDDLSCHYLDAGKIVYEGDSDSGSPVEEITTDYLFPRAPGAPAVSIPRVNYTKTVLNGTSSTTITKEYTATIPFSEESCFLDTSGCQDPADSGSVPIGGATSTTYSDFGGAFLKKEITTYEWVQDGSYLTANLLDIPHKIEVDDASGNPVSYSTYAYDESIYSPGGRRGHATTTTSFLNTGTSPATHTGWNGSGQKIFSIDAKGNVNNNGHTIDYQYTQCNNSYLSGTTNALNQSISGSYDCNTGLLASFTDANSNPFLFTYDAMNRITSATHPDGGLTSYTYYDSQNKVTRTITAAPDPTQTVSVVFDGLGRETNRTITDSPQSETIDTAYDLNGGVKSVSNPHRSTSSSTDGITSYAYDALGRKVLQCQPDDTTAHTACDTSTTGNSFLQWSYLGSTTRSTDEDGNSWVRTADALNRLKTVVEPNGSSTTYGYDELGDLTSVNQVGIGADGQRSRNFSYDSLSRLICASNPENSSNQCPQSATSPLPTGVVSYSYSTNGSLCAGDISLPCSKMDARGIGTGYIYDALNRMINKGGSDGSFIYTYTYDQGGHGSSIGRLTNQSNNAGAAVDIFYDSMGRVSQQNYCVPTNCSYGIQASAAYDLAGNLTSLTYPDGRTVTQGFDGAGRMSSVGYTNWNGNSHNTPYLSANLLPEYDSAGHLINATMGNGTGLAASYDNRERIGTLAYGTSSQLLWGKQYQWSPNSNLQMQIDALTGTQRQFGYDNLNRLTGVQDIVGASPVDSSPFPMNPSDPVGSSGGAAPSWTDPDDSNVLPNPDTPGAEGWGISNATIVRGVIAPDGSTTAASFTANAGSTDSFLTDEVSQPYSYGGETMTGSVWLQSPSGPQTVALFLLQTGQSGFTAAAAKFVTVTTTWQQFELSGQAQRGLTSFYIQIGGNGLITSGKTISLWNTKVEDSGSLAPTVTNFLPNSQRLTASSWGKEGLTAIDNSAQAPDGTNTAATVTASSADSWFANSVQSPAPFSGLPATGSVWLRSPSGSQNILLTLIEIGSSGWSTLGASTITLTSDWQRFQVSGITQSALTNLNLQIGGAATFTNGQSIQVWGAQLELASIAGPYVATGGTAASTGTSLTNLLSYSQQPNGPSWNNTYNFPGVPNDVVAPDGSQTGYEATAGGGAGWLTNDVANPALYNSATLTGSVFLRSPSGSGSIIVSLIGENASGRLLFQQITAQMTSTWQRFTLTGQAPNGMTRLLMQIGQINTAGQVIDVWGTQMEIASTAGPYIATSALPVVDGKELSNILPNSQQLNGPTWGISNGTVVTNAGTAPDGTTTAAVVTAYANSPDTYAADSVPNPSLYDGQTVTGSVFLRVTSGTLNTNIYLVNVGNAGWSVPAGGVPVAVTTTWQRFSITGTNQNGLTSLYLQIGGGDTIGSGQSLQIWGAQMVVGTEPAPYTPTIGGTIGIATGQPATLLQNGLNESYSYDSFGNILQNGGFNSTYTAQNQMSGYAYDAAGNLLSNYLTAMTWDAESKLISAGGATYIYDAVGNRVEKQGVGVTDTIYFGGHPIARLSGGQWTDLIYGPNGLLAEVAGNENAQPEYRLLDHLGTQVGTVDSSGLLTNPLDYTPFGQVFSGATNDPYMFTGKERDNESGLDYFGARYYGSSMGRFMSPDWADKPEAVPYSSLDNPQSLNLYAYVGNNPLGRVDTDGHIYNGSSDSGGNIDGGWYENAVARDQQIDRGRANREAQQQSTSAAGVAFIEGWEGWNGTVDKKTGLTYAKDDGFGNGTIGWGHNCGKCADFKDGITKEQGEALLKSDLAGFEKSVNGLGASLSQQQFDGLVSFAFNVRNYGSSTLFGNVSSGTAVTEANFTAYGHAHVGGKLVEVPSLMARRRSEYNIYANGVYDSSH